MNIPNSLTLIRILLVPLVVYLILTGESHVAFWIFIVAGVTDGLDGFLAKRFDWKTELGAYLDPLADKLLLVSIYIVLGLVSAIPVWLVIAVVTRDILIVGAVLLSWVLDRAVRVQPLMVSKANTLFQIVLAALVLGDISFSLGLGQIIAYLVWLTGGLTVVSAGAYLVSWIHDMAVYEPPPPPRRRRKASGPGRSGSGQMQGTAGR